GIPRKDFVLGDLLGGQYVALGRESERPREPYSDSLHSYLRVEASAQQPRHEILQGFDGTDILPFGGWLGDVLPAQGAQVLLSYVPPFPVYPRKPPGCASGARTFPGCWSARFPKAGGWLS